LIWISRTMKLFDDGNHEWTRLPVWVKLNP